MADWRTDYLLKTYVQITTGKGRGHVGYIRGLFAPRRLFHLVHFPCEECGANSRKVLTKNLTVILPHTAFLLGCSGVDTAGEIQ